MVLDLSVGELAARAGLDAILVMAYEQGQGLPMPMDMVALARVLEKPIGFFFGTDRSGQAA